MSRESSPPAAYGAFVGRFPALAKAWDLVREEEDNGPLDTKARRLLKLAVAIGAHRPGAVHSAARKAQKAGASEEEILQVVALAASTLGFPATVAAYGWVQDILNE